MTAVEILRDEAKSYELRAIAAGDQREKDSALAFKVVAIALYETADALEHELEHSA